MCARTLFPPKGRLVHAYLILAHKNLDQLPRLIERLDTGAATFYLHLDRNTDSAAHKREIHELSGIPNVHWVERHRSPWATFGVVQAQRAGIEAALKMGAPFTHLTLLTGQDYPIKPPHEIDLFFDNHQGTSFIWHNPGNTKAEKKKLQRQRYRSWHLYFAGKWWMVPPRLLKKVGIKRKIPGGLRPVKGWAFFTLSRECAEYASEFVKHNPRYVRFFKHTHFPDEYFWHTILLNSPFENKITNTNLQYARYIPPTGRGATFGKENLDELKNAASENYFFAKKFDVTVDSDILDLVDRELLHIE
jgi:Core-2/I-Branching enzyme